MPIKREAMEGLPEPSGRGPSVANTIEEFLARNPETGYTYKELREALKLNSQSVSSACKRLAEAETPKIIRVQDEAGTVFVAIANQEEED